MRVHRSFAFVDVSGFTAMTERDGDERAVEILSAFRSLLRDICSRRGVRIAKWLGDGVMLVCVEIRPPLAAILELHFVVGEVAGPIETVSIRSGISSGEVILMEGDDYIGHSVNVAARLSDLAQAGQALATPSVLDHLPPWGTVLMQEEITLRGVGSPIEVAHIGIGVTGEPGSKDPVCGLPLCESIAEESAPAPGGGTVLFCSAGCLDTWQRRPSAAAS